MPVNISCSSVQGLCVLLLRPQAGSLNFELWRFCGLPARKNATIYIDLLYAQASLGTRDYTTAAIRAAGAFRTFRDIHTMEKIAWVTRIHHILAEKAGHNREWFI